MPWYFIPDNRLPKFEDDERSAEDFLRSQSIPLMSKEITAPYAASGIALFTEDLEGVLRVLGLSDVDYTEESSSLPDVIALKFKGQRRKARVRVVRPAVAAEPDALVAGYLEAATVVRDQANEAAAGAQADVERLTAELTAATRVDQEAQMQLAILGDLGAAVAEQLRHEHAAIAALGSVASVGTTDGTLIVETNDIVISRRLVPGAAGPPARHRIGRLRVALGLFDGSIVVTALDALASLPHPIVSQLGLPYLGPVRDSLVRLVARRELSAAVKMLLAMLANTPRAPEAEALLAEWPQVP